MGGSENVGSQQTEHCRCRLFRGTQRVSVRTMHYGDMSISCQESYLIQKIDTALMLLVQWFSSARAFECNIDLNEPLIKDFEVKFQDMNPFGSWQESHWLDGCWRLRRVGVKCWSFVLGLLLVSIFSSMSGVV